MKSASTKTQTFTLVRYKSGQVSFPKRLADALEIKDNEPFVVEMQSDGSAVVRKQRSLEEDLSDFYDSLPQKSLDAMKLHANDDIGEMIKNLYLEKEIKEDILKGVQDG